MGLQTVKKNNIQSLYYIMCPKNMNKTFVIKKIRTMVPNITMTIVYDIVNVVYYNVSLK